MASNSVRVMVIKGCRVLGSPLDVLPAFTSVNLHIIHKDGRGPHPARPSDYPHSSSWRFLPKITCHAFFRGQNQRKYLFLAD